MRLVASLTPEGVICSKDQALQAQGNGRGYMHLGRCMLSEQAPNSFTGFWGLFFVTPKSLRFCCIRIFGGLQFFAMVTESPLKTGFRQMFPDRVNRTGEAIVCMSAASRRQVFYELFQSGAQRMRVRLRPYVQKVFFHVIQLDCTLC